MNDSDSLVWTDLQNRLKDVFDRKPITPRRYFELYGHVYNFLTAQSTQPNQSRTTRGQGMAPRYRISVATAAYASSTACNIATDFMKPELNNKLKAFIEAVNKSIFEEFIDKQGKDLLKCYNSKWLDYKRSADMADGIFSFLNKRNDKLQTVYKLCLEHWQEALSLTLKDRIINASLDLIAQERSGKTVNTDMISGVVTSFVELGMGNEEELNASESEENDGLEAYLLRLKESKTEPVE